MDIPKSDIVGIIFQLLPGFITAWIFYGLTAHPQKSPFERTIQALIFTGLVQAIVLPIGWIFLFATTLFSTHTISWTENVSFFVSVLVSIFFGLGVSACANSNLLHQWLCDISKGRITRRTSYPSEWFSAFMRKRRMIYLHLHDGRRLFGWPQEWPDSPMSGHFVLAIPEWILEDNTRTPLIYTEWLLVPATDVRMVEFEKEDVTSIPLKTDGGAQQAKPSKHSHANYDNSTIDSLLIKQEVATETIQSEAIAPINNDYCENSEPPQNIEIEGR